MGNDDQRLAVFPMGQFQQFHNLLGVFAVQVARGFVGQHQGRGVHQGTADGDPLLLAAGQLIGQMPLPAPKTQGFHQFPQPFRIDCAPVHQHRQGDILHHIEHRYQIVELIDQSHLTAAENGQLVFILCVDILAVQIHMAAGGTVHTAQNMQQRRFAGAGRADNCQKFSFFHGKRHVIQRFYRILSPAVYLAEVFYS